MTSPRDTTPLADQSHQTELPVETDPDAGRRYRAYRRRQAAGLASVLPREAIRPLYARAREWARSRDLAPGDDPLAVLLLFLEDLLPLPPMDVWMEDRARNLRAHLEEEFESPQAHGRPSPPVLVASRGIELDGRRWTAALNVFRRQDAWRGFVAFDPMGPGDSLRTADVFREDRPDEIRARFLSFRDDTVKAFLRSVLP